MTVPVDIQRVSPCNTRDLWHRGVLKPETAKVLDQSGRFGASGNIHLGKTIIIAIKQGNATADEMLPSTCVDMVGQPIGMVLKLRFSLCSAGQQNQCTNHPFH
jgi:hypothetical protein